jgi:predicted metal-dependent hydrolase
LVPAWQAGKTVSPHSKVMISKKGSKKGEEKSPLGYKAFLVSVDRETGDYVIVHELLHFSVPNHGKLWKTLMRAHLGDYEHAEKELQRLTQAKH